MSDVIEFVRIEKIDNVSGLLYNERLRDFFYASDICVDSAINTYNLNMGNIVFLSELYLNGSRYRSSFVVCSGDYYYELERQFNNVVGDMVDYLKTQIVKGLKIDIEKSLI